MRVAGLHALKLANPLEEGRMSDVKEQGLVSVDEDDWAVADGEPDVRGWDVVTADRRRIGAVDDLLADPAAMKVRFITVDLDREMRTADNAQTVRIPISRTRIHEDEHKVVVDFDAANVRPVGGASTHRWNADDISPRPWTDDEIKLTRSAEELRIGKRQVKAGEVEVRKHVETEHVRERVQLRSEEVDIERRPAAGDAHGRDVQIGADEIRVPIYEEEAVVEKRPVVKEEVVISKRPTEKTEAVEADLRHERIDVDKQAEVRSRERNRSRE
jgi:uncharacterized protein (TIGR02271 family)